MIRMITNNTEIKIDEATVEIKKEDITTSDGSDEKSKNILNFSSTITATNGNNNCHNLKQGKTQSELPDIKTEDDSDSDHFVETWTIGNKNCNAEQVKKETHISEMNHQNHINLKTEDDDDLSDHFLETCIKSEKIEYGREEYNKTIDSEFLNRDYEEAYIKQEILDIKDEDHSNTSDTDEPYSQSNKPRKHRNTQKNPKKLKCNSCNFKTSTQRSLEKHLYLHEDPNKIALYFCTKCNYRTKQKCHLKRHDLVHQSPQETTRFTCGICGVITKQKCTLKRHITWVHLNQSRESTTGNNADSGSNQHNKLVYCDKCSYRTHKKGLLISHLDKHKDPGDITNLYICDICSFFTKYRRNLRMHLDTHKESQQLQIYECKICDFKTRIPYCLKRHLRTRKHLRVVGKLDEYRPRPSQKL